MSVLTLLLIVAALGMRHGVDPDHLSAIDGLSRLHPSRWNGVLFAVGHGLLVTLLAVGFGTVLAKLLQPFSIWLLLLVGVANLWRLLKPARVHPHSARLPGFVQASPLMLGILFGMGFETASQLSALMLAAKLNPWLLGIVFSAGMVVVDGLDGYLAAKTQSAAYRGGQRAIKAGRMLGFTVVFCSFSLAAAEWLGYDLDRVALPVGISLFAVILGLRLWSSSSLPYLKPRDARLF